MGTIFETAATLRFFGDDLDPDEITSILGAEPTVGVRKRGVWRTSRGAEKIARTGSWRLEVPRRRPGDLDGQITELLAPLTSDLPAWNPLAERYGGNIFCGVWLNTGNGEFSLTPKTLAAVGGRGLLLELDLYDAEMRVDAPAPSGH